MKSPLYLDHNATAPLRPEAREAMLTYLGDRDANPSSLYLEAEQVRADLEGARSRMAGALGVRPGELYFTSGATESINWAIRGVVAAQPEKRRLLTTAVEHSATLDVASRLGEEGLNVTFLRVDQGGRLDLDQLKASLEDDVALLSIMWTNNETGVEFDIAAVAHLCREAGVLIHVDAAQKVGRGLPSLADLPVDLLSFSAHKFGGPKGVGGLVVRRGVGLRPLIWGSRHEGGRRGGTENVAGIMGMAAALDVSVARWPEEGPRIRALRDRLQNQLTQALPDLIVNGAETCRNENTLNVACPGIEGHGVVLTLSQKGLACASGSACTAHDDGPSHVLEAMGVDGHFIHGALRFSLGEGLQEEDIDRAATLIVDAVRYVGRI